MSAADHTATAVVDGDVIWTPSVERSRSTAMSALLERHGLQDGRVAHQWSIREPEEFWRTVWQECSVIGHMGDRAFDAGDGSLRSARFFPDARLSFTENMLGHAPDPDGDAIVSFTEHGSIVRLSWSQLTAAVAAAAAALRAEGVIEGDRVAAVMPNVPETVIVMLAALALGAIFTSTSPDFGAEGVLDRFGQVEPVVLFAADGYRYAGKEIRLADRVAEIRAGLPSVRRVVVVSCLGAPFDVDLIADGVGYDEWIDPHRAAPLIHERRPFDQPALILYSSGTTGPPKCIVHRAGGVLLTHLKEQRFHCDIRPDDRVFYFTTCGWMMFNWLSSALASGATIVLYDGSPMHPSAGVLFDVADAAEVTLFGVSAKYLDGVRKAGVRPRDTHRLSGLRTICSTGSPLHADGFRYVYDAVANDVHLASISGGTDLCGCFVGGDPTQPVRLGEIQGPMLAMDVDVVGEDGVSVAVGVSGELVCRNPFPSMPLGFWGDRDGARYSAAYFERFDGVWAHGDFASWTASGGLVIHGRSDATLNAGGVRIGTAELYRVVEQMEDVLEAIAVGQEWDGDTRIVMFLRTRDGRLDADLQERIRTRIRQRCSPRHVPARLAVVSDVPRTRSGKISEIAVADVVNGRTVRNVGALENPESLEQFRQRPEMSV